MNDQLVVTWLRNLGGFGSGPILCPSLQACCIHACCTNRLCSLDAFLEADLMFEFTCVLMTWCPLSIDS